MNITYEKLTTKDYQRVKELVTQAWFEEYNFSKKVIDLYAKGYLYMYLSELDYCIVAKDGDRVVGFIFGRNNKVNLFKKIHYKLKLFFVGLRLLFSKAGRRGLKINHITNKVNAELYKKSKTTAKAELVLFIVDEAYRGQGIGSKLERDFYEFLKNNNKKYVYLYTDTYSNFAYYEQRGYKRMAELDVDFHIEGEEDDKPTYYIYVKEIVWVA